MKISNNRNAGGTNEKMDECREYYLIASKTGIKFNQELYGSWMPSFLDQQVSVLVEDGSCHIDSCSSKLSNLVTDRTCSICASWWLWCLVLVSTDENVCVVHDTFFWRHHVKRISTFSSRLPNQTSAHQWPYVLLALQLTHVILLTPQWTANTSHIVHMLPSLEAWAGWPVDWSKSHKCF